MAARDVFAAAGERTTRRPRKTDAGSDAWRSSVRLIAEDYVANQNPVRVP